MSAALRNQAECFDPSDINVTVRLCVEQLTLKDSLKHIVLFHY